MQILPNFIFFDTSGSPKNNNHPPEKDVTISDSIINYIAETIVKNAASEAILQKLTAIKKLTAPNREKAYIPVYFDLENFILLSQNKTEEAFREEIKSKFPIHKTSVYFRLIFESEAIRSLMLLEIALSPFVTFVMHSLDERKVEEILNSFLKTSQLKGVKVSKDGLDFSDTYNLIQLLDKDEANRDFINLYQTIYDLFTNTFGENKAKDIVNEIFTFVKHSYEYSIVSEFINNLPLNVLEEERVSYLGKRELEKLVEDRTRQLKESQERELQKTKELLKLKDEFVFIAAHDLRTPVTAILGYISLLEDQYNQMNNETKYDFDNIKEAAQRLNQLINDLLQIARAESGMIKAELKSVDIVLLFEKSVKEIEPEINSKNISIYVELDTNNTFVNADEMLLSEVIENLLSNAIKYNKSKGMIIIQSFKERDSLVITIADTGLGIPIDAQKQIFSKFFRVQSDATANISGTGLGLFIVKMLIEKMNGTISFSSEEGKGTTFRFSLKLATK